MQAMPKEASPRTILRDAWHDRRSVQQVHRMYQRSNKAPLLGQRRPRPSILSSKTTTRKATTPSVAPSRPIQGAHRSQQRHTRWTAQATAVQSARLQAKAPGPPQRLQQTSRRRMVVLPTPPRTRTRTANQLGVRQLPRHRIVPVHADHGPAPNAVESSLSRAPTEKTVGFHVGAVNAEGCLFGAPDEAVDDDRELVSLRFFVRLVNHSPEQRHHP